MELFRSWLLGIIASALLLTIVYHLIPAGKVRTVAHLSGGLILLLAFLGPFGQLDPGWDLDYNDCAREIQRMIDGYQQENLDRTRAIIAERTAAYISDKGNELGIICHPVVSTYLDDGIPFPDAVTMDVPLQQELADCITRELGIPMERQFWQER
jgi:hypothetical protein